MHHDLRNTMWGVFKAYEVSFLQWCTCPVSVHKKSAELFNNFQECTMEKIFDLKSVMECQDFWIYQLDTHFDRFKNLDSYGIIPGCLIYMQGCHGMSLVFTVGKQSYFPDNQFCLSVQMYLSSDHHHIFPSFPSFLPYVTRSPAATNGPSGLIFCMCCVSICIIYISASKSTPLAVTNHHWQLASHLILLGKTYFFLYKSHQTKTDLFKGSSNRSSNINIPDPAHRSWGGFL